MQDRSGHSPFLQMAEHWSQEVSDKHNVVDCSSGPGSSSTKVKVHSRVAESATPKGRRCLVSFGGKPKSGWVKNCQPAFTRPHPHTAALTSGSYSIPPELILLEQRRSMSDAKPHYSLNLKLDTF